MAIVSFMQEYQQGVLAVGLVLAAVALYRILTRKSREVEALEQEYQQVLQAGKQPVKVRLSPKFDE